MTCDGLCGARLVATRGRAASSLGADEGLLVARMGTDGAAQAAGRGEVAASRCRQALAYVYDRFRLFKLL